MIGAGACGRVIAAVALGVAAAVAEALPASAQTNAGQSAPPPAANPRGVTLNQISIFDNFQFLITAALFAFCIAIIILQIVSLLRIQATKPDDVLKNVAVTLVITGTLVIIIAGYSQAEVAPAFGLFGTVIGYILGRSDRREAPPPGDQPAKKE